VGADLVQAYKWFILSAEQQDVVGKHYFEDYNLHHRVTAEQMAQAQKMAAEFRARLRNAKHRSASVTGVSRAAMLRAPVNPA
jgi:TPR repeat protein